MAVRVMPLREGWPRSGRVGSSLIHGTYEMNCQSKIKNSTLINLRRTTPNPQFLIPQGKNYRAERRNYFPGRQIVARNPKNS